MPVINGGASQPGLGKGAPLHSAAIANGTAQVQTLTPTGTISSGTFSLTLYGETTSAIAYNAAASAIVAALAALKCVGASGVSATGGTIDATPVLITFGTSSNGNLWSVTVPLLVVNDINLAGSSPLITPTISTPAALATHRNAATGALLILDDGSSAVKHYINTSQIAGKPTWAVVGSQS